MSETVNDLVSTSRDPSLAVSQQGHYANAVTRLAAFAVDQSLATGLFAVTTAVIAWAVSLVTSDQVTWNPPAWFTGLLLLCWLFIYYSYPWAVSGKTPGMALLGIRVVRADGAPAGPRHAIVRTVTFPLGFLTLGLGFLPIIFGRQHRALYDSIANTAVVYSWDARAARLRFLARQQRTDESTPTN